MILNRKSVSQVYISQGKFLSFSQTLSRKTLLAQRFFLFCFSIFACLCELAIFSSSVQAQTFDDLDNDNLDRLNYREVCGWIQEDEKNEIFGLHYDDSKFTGKRYRITVEDTQERELADLARAHIENRFVFTCVQGEVSSPTAAQIAMGIYQEGEFLLSPLNVTHANLNMRLDSLNMRTWCGKLEKANDRIYMDLGVEKAVIEFILPDMRSNPNAWQMAGRVFYTINQAFKKFASLSKSESESEKEGGDIESLGKPALGPAGCIYSYAQEIKAPQPPINGRKVIQGIPLLISEEIGGSYGLMSN